MADQKGSIRTSNPGNLTWFKNVAKSLGYTSTELVTSIAPSMSDFFSENVDYGKELISDLREIKSDGQKFGKLFDGNQQLGIARDALKNAIEDVKSGKIYNKDRQASLHEDDFGSDFDFGMDDFSFDGGDDDFSLGDDDFSVDDSPSKPQVIVPNISVKTIAPPIMANNPMVKAVEQQTSATLRAAQANADVQTTIATSQAMMSRKMGSANLHGLQTINDNISLLANFHSTSMSKYIGASLKYYEDSLNAMNDTLAQLKQSNEGTQVEERKRSSDPMDDILQSNGGLNIKAYVSQVKKNLDTQMSENMFLQPIKMMFEDTGTLQYLAASPLSFISTKVITTLIPQFLQSSMQNLDKSFSAFFPALLMKINRMAESSSNPFIQILGEIFGATTRTKSTIDLSRYNRGQIPFDGETKKSIVEVIPGYLRKILAAISGQKEMAFDYNDGTFKTVESMQQTFDRSRDSRALSPFMDAMDSIKERSEAFLFDSLKEREEFNTGIADFFKNLSKQGHLINPNLYKDKDGFEVDELADVHDFKGDTGMQKLFRQLILTMPKNQQMKIFGQDVIESRKNVKSFMETSEDNPLIHNANVLFNGLGHDEHLNEKNKKETKQGFGLFNPTDKFGSTSLDYLRSIKTILLQGIRVFPAGGSMSGGTPSPDGGAQPNDEIATILKNQQSQRTHMLTQQRDLVKAQKKKAEEQDRTLDYNDEQAEKAHDKGQKYISSTLDIASMSNEDINAQIQAREEARKTFSDDNGKDKNIAQWFGKFLKGNTQEKYNLLREKVDNLLQKPAQMLKGVFDKIDNAMYGVIFGTPGQREGGSFFERTMNTLAEKFENLGLWMKTTVFEPIKESLVGENGIITKMQNSEFYNSLKKNTKRFADWMFGKPDENGARRDGLLSDTGNNILDMWDAAKYYFSGKGYVNRAGQKFDDNDESVLNQARNVFKSFGKDLKTYLVGDKKAEDKDNQKGVLSGVMGGLKEGFVNFKDAIFGPSGMTKKSADMTFKEMTESVKKKMPKSLAWGTVGAGIGTGVALSGGLGLMGSIFLPGGPIGAAVLGTSLGFLSQSDRFMNWMFGEKNANNDRIGGVISKGMQDWFAKNKSFLVGGAALGALKPILGAGLLPSFLLPGGPIAGALFGVGTAMLVRSEGFQKMMFGPKDADGNRVGGLLKSFGKFGNKLKGEGNNLFGNIGAGALGGAGIAAVVGKLGLMGAMLTPAGPIGGALLGAAAGIALSSDRWKKALFGEWDEKSGLRKGGMLGKFTNWFTLEVQEPLKNQLQKININFQEWFTTKISNPFVDALAPMKQAFKDMTEKLSDFFKSGWDSFKEKIGTVFEENVGKPFGKFMNENVMKPLKGFLSKIIMGAGKILAPIAEAPIKVFSAIGDSFRKKQEKRGVERHVEDGWNDMTDTKGRRERGERMGLFNTKDADGNKIGKGIFGRMNDMYFNKEAREDAKYGEHGASYAREEDARIKERNEQQAEKFKQMREAVDKKEKKLDVRRRAGYKHDYDNFDEEGNDISRIYNITKSKSGYAHFMKKGEGQNYGKSISKHLGVDLADLLQVADRDSFDPGQLSKNQRKLVLKAIKSGLVGNELKKFMGVKDQPKEEAPVEKPAEEKVGEAVKESSEVIKSSVEAMTEKMTEALKDSSPKDQIEKILVPQVKETNTKLTEIASQIGHILGTSSKTFKIKKAGGDTSNIPVIHGGQPKIENVEKRLPKVLKLKRPRQDDDTHSHASGLDNVPHDGYQATLHQGEMVVPAKQANEIRESAGAEPQKESKATGPVNASNRLVNNLPSGDMPKDKMSILMRIAGDVRHIAKEVDGQLDGVGSNVYKLRKIAQKQAGMTDGDFTGSANRDRVGFMGKLRRALFRPFETIRNKVVDAFAAVTNKIRAFGEGVAKVGKAIVMVPVNIVKGIGQGIWTAMKGFGSIIKTAATEIAKLPGKLIGVVGSAIDAVGHAVKALGPALGKAIEGVAGFIGGAFKGLGNVIAGVGKGIGAFAENFGKSVGQIVGTLGTTTVKLLGSIGTFVTKSAQTLVSVGGSLLKSAGNLITGTTKMLTDFTLSTISKMGEVAKNVVSTVFDVISSPFKLIGGALSKVMGKVNEVRITGGHLDTIKEVALVKELPSTHDESRDHKFIQSLTNAIKEGIKSLLPMPVINMGGGHGGDDHDGGQSTSGKPHPSAGKSNGAVRSARRGPGRVGRAVRNKVASTIAPTSKSSKLSGVRSAISGGLTGGFKNQLMGTFVGFMNKRRNNFATADKLTKMNIVPGVNGNVIPFPQPNQMSGVIGDIANSVFGTMKLPNPFGGGTHADNSVNLGGKVESAPIRDVNHESQVREEKAEKSAAAGFRVATVGLLSMIESNTRRSADNLDWIVAWLKKFKMPNPCCGGGFLGGGGGGGGGYFGGSPGGAGAAGKPGGAGAAGKGGAAGGTGAGGYGMIGTAPNGRNKKGKDKDEEQDHDRDKNKKGPKKTAGGGGAVVTPLEHEKDKNDKDKKGTPKTTPVTPVTPIEVPDKDKKDKDNTKVKTPKHVPNPGRVIEFPGIDTPERKTEKPAATDKDGKVVQMKPKTPKTKVPNVKPVPIQQVAGMEGMHIPGVTDQQLGPNGRTTTGPTMQHGNSGNGGPTRGHGSSNVYEGNFGGNRSGGGTGNGGSGNGNKPKRGRRPNPFTVVPNNTDEPSMADVFDIGDFEDRRPQEPEYSNRTERGQARRTAERAARPKGIKGLFASARSLLELSRDPEQAETRTQRGRLQRAAERRANPTGVRKVVANVADKVAGLFGGGSRRNVAQTQIRGGNVTQFPGADNVQDVVDNAPDNSQRSPQQSGGRSQSKLGRAVGAVKGLFTRDGGTRVTTPNNVTRMPAGGRAGTTKLGKIVNGAKGVGKGLLGGAKGLGRGLGAIGRGVGGVLGSVPGMSLLMGGANAYATSQRADTIFGGEATKGQKIAAGVGGGIVGAIPGLGMVDLMLGGKISNGAAKLSYGAAGALGAAGGWIGDKAKGVGNYFKDVGTAMKESELGDKVRGGIQNVKNFGKGAWDTMKAVPGVLGMAGRVGLDGIKFAGQEGWKGAKNLAGKAWDGTKDFFGDVGRGAKKFGNGLAETKVGKAVGKAKDATKDFFGDVGRGAKKFGSGLAEFFGGKKAHASDGKLSQKEIDAWRKEDNRNILQKGVDKVKGAVKGTWEDVKSGNVKGLAKRAFNASPIGLAAKGVGKLNDKLGDPLGKAKEGLKTLADSVGKSVDDIKKSTGKAWDTTKEAVGKKWDETKTAFSNTVDNIKTKTSETWNNAKETAGKAWDNTKDAVGKAVDNIKTKTGEVWNKTKDAAGKAWDNTKDAVGKAVDNIKTKTGEVWDKTKETAGKAWDATKTKFSETVEGIKTKTGEVWNSAKETAGKKWDEAKTKFSDTVEGIKSKTGEVWNSAKETAGKKWDEAKTKFSDTVEGIKTKTGEVWSSAKDVAGKKWDETKTKFSETVEGIKSKTSEVWNTTKDTVGKKWDETKTKFSETVEGIKTKTSDVWNSTKEAVGKKWDEAKTKLSETVEGIKTKTSTVWTSAKETVGKKWDEAKTKFSETVEGIKSKTASVWNSAKETAAKKWDETKKNISDKASSIASDAKSKFDAAKTAAAKNWDSAKKNISDKASSIASDAKSKFESAKSAASKKWDEAKSNITSKASSIASDAKSKFDAAKSAASTQWSNAKSNISNKASEISSDVKSKFESARSSASSKLSSMASEAASKASGIKSAVTSALSSAASSVASGLSSLASKAKSIWNSVTGKGFGNGVGVDTAEYGQGPGDINDKLDLAVQKIKDSNPSITRTVYRKAVTPQLTDSIGGSSMPVPPKPIKKMVIERQEDDNSERIGDGPGSIRKINAQRIGDGPGSLRKINVKRAEGPQLGDFMGGQLPDKPVVDKEIVRKTPEKELKIDTGIFKSAINRARESKPLRKSLAMMNSVLGNSKSINTGISKLASVFSKRKNTKFTQEDRDNAQSLANERLSSLYRKGELATEQFDSAFDTLNKQWGAGSGEAKPEFGAGSTKTLNGMPYYSQNDSRWANKSLTKGTKKKASFGKAGCGPTTAAMVLSAVTGQEVTPNETLAVAQDGGYVDPNRGTRSDFFQGVGAKYGVPILPQGNDMNAIKQDLAMKRPVILRGQGGKAFTDGGHYVVATGMNKDGKILVNDPISKNRSKAYDPNELMKNTTSSYVAMPGMGKAKTKGKGKGLLKQFGSGNLGDNSPLYFGRGKGSVDDIIKEAKTWIGTKYVFGGNTKSGVDCSGFTLAVFRDAGGIQLHRTAAMQATQGTRLKNSEIRKGDLVFFSNTYKPGISHVGIALGEGKFIGANGDSVKISDYTTGYYKTKFDHGRRYDLEGTGQPGSSGIEDSTSSSSSSAASALTGAALWLWKQSKLSETFDTIAMNGLTGKKEKVDWTVPTSDGSTPTTTDGNEQPPAGKVSGTEVANKVWNILADHKLSSNAIAGILGNLQAESSMDPKKLQAGGKKNTGAGLAQWTIGGRWDVLKNFAKSKNMDHWSADAQAEFIWHELNYKGNPWGSPSELNKKSARDAALYFSNKFERPNPKYAHNDNRMNYAEQWYKKLGGGKGFGMGDLPEFGAGSIQKAPIGDSPSGTGTDKVFGMGCPPDSMNEFGAGPIQKALIKTKPLKLEKLPPISPTGDGPSGPGISSSFGKGNDLNSAPEFGAGMIPSKKPIVRDVNPIEDKFKEVLRKAESVKAPEAINENKIKEATKAAVENIKNRTTQSSVRVSDSRAPKSFGMGLTDSYMMQQQTQAVSSSDPAIMKQAVDILLQIANNTKSTSEGISSLVKKADTVVADKKQDTAKNDRDKTNVQVNNSNSSFNANPIIGAMNSQQPSARGQKDYSVAKMIAAGRI